MTSRRAQRFQRFRCRPDQVPIRLGWRVVLFWLSSVLWWSGSQSVLAEPLAAQVEALAKAARVPGGALVVIRDGAPSAVRGFGRLDRRGHRPTPDTVFPVGLISAVVTALTAALVTAQTPALDLDGDLRARWPWLDLDGREPLTLRQLLSHTAGFDDRLAGIVVSDGRAVPTLRAELRRRLPDRTTAAGGTPRFSHYGVGLAGLAIEEALAAPLRVLVAQRVALPLGLERTSLAAPLPVALETQRARAYPCPDARCQPLARRYWRVGPAGNLVSSPHDMATLMMALLGEVAGPMRAAAMQVRGDGRIGRPLGLHRQRLRGAASLAISGGTAGGYRSVLLLVPSRRAGLFLVATGGSLEFGRTMVAAFADSLDLSPLPAPAGLTTTPAVVGTYLAHSAPLGNWERFVARFTAIDVLAADGNFVIRRTAGGVDRYQYEQHDGTAGALLATDGARLVLRRGASGQVDGYVGSVASFGARFPAEFRRLRAWEHPAFIHQWLPWLLFAPLLLLVAWIARAALRPPPPLPLPNTEDARSRPLLRVGHVVAVAVVMIALALLFFFQFMLAVQQLAQLSPEVLALGVPPEIARWRWAPLGLVAAIGALGYLAMRTWPVLSAWDRAVIGLAALCAVLFVLILAYFRLLLPVQ